VRLGPLDLELVDEVDEDAVPRGLGLTVAEGVPDPEPEPVREEVAVADAEGDTEWEAVSKPLAVPEPVPEAEEVALGDPETDRVDDPVAEAETDAVAVAARCGCWTLSLLMMPSATWKLWRWGCPWLRKCPIQSQSPSARR
jgi:hypothetical protein